MRTNVPALLLALLLGALARAQAEPEQIDRALVERIVRAQETQARAAEQQAYALDGIGRELERCRR